MGRNLAVSNTLTVNGAVCCPSDARLKQDIAPLGPSLEKLLQLRGVTFKWKEPGKHGNRTGTQVGVVAQEVEKVFPDWVVTGSDGYRAVSYPGFEALTVESFRELKGENDQLKGKVASLEERLSAIENRDASKHASVTIDGRWSFAALFGVAFTAVPLWLRRRRKEARDAS